MDKLIKRIHGFKPPLLLSCILTVVFGAGSLLASATDFGERIPAAIRYAIYAGAGVSLFLLVWAALLFLKKAPPKQQFLEAAGRNDFTARLIRDFSFRTKVIAAASLTFNVILALSKMFAGWYYASTWLMVLSAYYLILCVSRILLLRYSRKQSMLNDENAIKLHEWKAYRLCGIMFIILTVFLQGVVIMIVRDGMGFVYNEIVVIGMAAFDFYCLTAAIIYMVRKRKSHSPMVTSLKSISLASSLVAILSLQTAMFSSFGGGNDGLFRLLMNIFTGTAVCIFLIVLGTRMIVRSNRELKLINIPDIKTEE